MTFDGPSDEAIEMSPPMLDESVEVSSSCRKMLLSNVDGWFSLLLAPPVLARVCPSPTAVAVVPVPALVLVVVAIVPEGTETEILSG